jgi:hypothetical protein
MYNFVLIKNKTGEGGREKEEEGDGGMTWLGVGEWS